MRRDPRDVLLPLDSMNECRGCPDVEHPCFACYERLGAGATLTSPLVSYCMGLGEGRAAPLEDCIPTMTVRDAA